LHRSPHHFQQPRSRNRLRAANSGDALAISPDELPDSRSLRQSRTTIVGFQRRIFDCIDALAIFSGGAPITAAARPFATATRKNSTAAERFSAARR